MDIPDVHYAHNGEVALAYQVWGEGPPDLVFVPQWIGNIEVSSDNPLYARFLKKLASFSRLILVDPRGTGLSDRLSPADVPPLEVMMDDLMAVLDAVASERAVLFGGSENGALCALFAATYPERTKALIAYSTSPRGDYGSEYGGHWTENDWDVFLADLAEGWGTPEYVKRTFEWAIPSFVGDPEQLRWWTRLQRLSASPNAMLAIERVWRQFDIRLVLPTIQVPTLVLHRTGDAVDNVEAGRDFARRIPGAEFVELPGDDWLAWAGDQARLLMEVEMFLAGIRKEEATFDRVLATVLFTDIVDSTVKAAELGDTRWKQLLEHHHAVTRSLLGRYRGTEIDTAGDGFFATFEGPARGVRCAQAITEAVRTIGLEARAGLHTGEVETADGLVAGIAVHIGARIGAMAQPSEVLVSSTVKDLVAGSGLSFEDRGEHELKGVPDRWRLYSVASG
jgi:class 3 adenylate cyclase